MVNSRRSMSTTIQGCANRASIASSTKTERLGRWTGLTRRYLEITCEKAKKSL